MSAEQIESKVKNIIAEHLGVGVEQVRSESSFADDLGADSLDIVELVMAFEELFQLEIPEDEAENIRTVKDAINYIQEHRSAA